MTLVELLMPPKEKRGDDATFQINLEPQNHAVECVSLLLCRRGGTFFLLRCALYLICWLVKINSTNQLKRNQFQQKHWQCAQCETCMCPSTNRLLELRVENRITLSFIAVDKMNNIQNFMLNNILYYHSALRGYSEDIHFFLQIQS